ncbi:MAG: extracellular solute-binding protein [Verrucomicrobiae bacterium]|nr:extracellular solute-binding protein [Verrucomicrobiae bacterium]
MTFRLTRFPLSVSCVLTVAAFLGLVPSLAPAAPAPSAAAPVTVKVFSLPSKQAGNPDGIANYRVLERFHELHPHIRLTSSTALQIEGRGSDTAPLMSIAGGSSPDIIYVNFRISDTYISQGFLQPLDEYLAKMSPEERAERLPKTVLPVVYRHGPGGKHYWAMPQRVLATVLIYRRDLFAAAGLDPNRAPRDWNELREFARKVADPAKGIYGLAFPVSPHASAAINSYLCSAGAHAVTQLPDGEWRATFDSDEAVTAYSFVDELQKEKVVRDGKEGFLAYRAVDASKKWADGRIAMTFIYLGGGRLGDLNPELIGVAPVPKGPTGRSSSEVNCMMLGIFAGQKDQRVRDAAWEYIRFLDSREARRIFTQTMVEQGGARMVHPKWLREFGYPQLALLSPPGLAEAYEQALVNGTPEPYGRNCQSIYYMMTRPLEQIYFTDFTGMNAEQRLAKIKDFLSAAVREANEKLIGHVPESVRRTRNAVAWGVAVLVAVGFVALLAKVFRWISVGQAPPDEKSSAYKTWFALGLLAPALGLILLWHYVPLARGTLIAFQDYRVMGGVPWVGISNFADVLFDTRFWLSLWHAAYFCALWMLLGFLPPMFLAILLQEIPKGKILYRVLFYLPAVVSGVVILFMWRAIYDPMPDGILNRILGVFGVPPQQWLQDPSIAMLCVVFPLAWAHLGPGCIIYLAALKGIPDELYEAADIDGAGFSTKVRFIVIPYMKPLLVINGVGALIHGFNSGSAVLAMTGGGPNMATHVVGYEIFERSFLFLRFGHGTAMAWIVGLLLLSFTAVQLRILNKVEFRTANR